MLIHESIYLTIVDKYGSTALHRAAGCGHHQTVSVLIQHAADVNATSQFSTFNLLVSSVYVIHVTVHVYNC